MDPVRRPSPFLEQVRAAIRVRHYSIRTEESYLFWVRRFILFHGKRHPRELGESQVGEFLTHLAVDRKVSASTQNQALNALVFLYKAVLERPLGDDRGCGAGAAAAAVAGGPACQGGQSAVAAP